MVVHRLAWRSNPADHRRSQSDESAGRHAWGYGSFHAVGAAEPGARSSPRATALYLAEVPTLDGKVTGSICSLATIRFPWKAARLLEQVQQRLLGMRSDRSSPWHGVEFSFAGITAGIHDLWIVNQSDFFRIAALTRFWVFVVLLVLLRRPFISLFLILTVLWGYVITIGVTKVVFMWFYGAAFAGVGWQLPLFLFVILVAVGEDYNIYLVVRVVEEQQRRGATEGVREPGPHGRDYHQLRRHHGGHVRLDDQRHPAGDAGDGVRAGLRRAIGHVRHAHDHRSHVLDDLADYVVQADASHDDENRRRRQRRSEDAVAVGAMKSSRGNGLWTLSASGTVCRVGRAAGPQVPCEPHQYVTPNHGGARCARPTLLEWPF